MLYSIIVSLSQSLLFLPSNYGKINPCWNRLDRNRFFYKFISIIAFLYLICFIVLKKTAFEKNLDKNHLFWKKPVFIGFFQKRGFFANPELSHTATSPHHNSPTPQLPHTATPGNDLFPRAKAPFTGTWQIRVFFNFSGSKLYFSEFELLKSKCLVVIKANGNH